MVETAEVEEHDCQVGVMPQDDDLAVSGSVAQPIRQSKHIKSFGLDEFVRTRQVNHLSTGVGVVSDR